jgi:uncharacterized Zn-finger protein
MPDGAKTTSPTETIIAKSRDVACNGGDGAYGHPKVYLKILDKQIVCPYCSRLFVLAAGVPDFGH